MSFGSYLSCHVSFLGTLDGDGEVGKGGTVREMISKTVDRDYVWDDVKTRNVTLAVEHTSVIIASNLR